MFKTAHLFAGGGGGLLCDLILGHTPVVAVEWDPYACAVLRSRFPGLRVIEGDVRSVDFTRDLAGVDAICAGFPCQDISTAGKGKGISGIRSGLYKEVIRAIDDVRPAWVFLENSPAIRTRGRHIVIADIVERGYSWRDGRIAAADVGAWHLRERWFCLASNSKGINVEKQAVVEKEGSHGEPGGVAGNGQEMGAPFWEVHQPPMDRVDDVMADWVDRSRAIGNGQVPLQAALAWKILGGP